MYKCFKQLLDKEDRLYQPLLLQENLPTKDAHAIPTSTILVAIPANMEAGESVSTKMLRQRSVLGALMDVEASATGIPFDAQMGSGAPGQLVFLPDLPSTVQLWHKQRALMWVWLVASLVPFTMAFSWWLNISQDSRLFKQGPLAPELVCCHFIAAVMGVIATLVQLCEKELATTNILELGAQIKLATICGTVACYLDAFSLVMGLLLMGGRSCDATADICKALMGCAVVFALSCVQHGILSFWVADSAARIMPLLNPRKPESVQLL